MRIQRASKGGLVYVTLGVINLCVVGMFMTILIPYQVPVQDQAITAASSKTVTGEAPVKINLGIATRIVVPSVNIDLPVRTGSYDPASQTWTLDTQSVFYADRSVPANDSNGTTLIYGHARWELFARLPEISEGATAQVYTDSGKIFSYVFASSREVQPEDTSIFVSSGDPTLALQTCSGPFDAYRTLVLFSLTGVSTQ